MRWLGSFKREELNISGSNFLLITKTHGFFLLNIIELGQTSQAHELRGSPAGYMEGTTGSEIKNKEVGTIIFSI